MVSKEFDARFPTGHLEEERLVQELNCNPYYQTFHSGADLYTLLNGCKYLNLASNNYLALANNPLVIGAMKSALDKYGASLCGTPVACGKVDIYEQAAQSFCRFLGLEEAILYPSCYQANVSVMKAVIKPEDVVFVDRCAHASLVEGIKASGCKIKPFKHNDVQHLEELIKKSKAYANRFVATESVFSTEGSIAPFDEIYRLAMQHDVIPIIDDSHGIGVIGNSGKGILEEKHIHHYEGIYTASTGKALGISGGVVCGSQQMIKFLRYSCPGLLYSTAIPPTLIAGTIKALEIISSKGPEMVRMLRMHKTYLSAKLHDQGFTIVPGEASICSLVAGTNEKTFKIYQTLYYAKILTTPFIFPSVAKNRGIIRMIPRIDLGKGQLDHVIETLIKAKEQYHELFE